MTLHGRPWSFQTLQRYRLAAPAAVIVVTVSMKCDHLPTESTTAMMVSYPPDSGSSTMKSTLMTSQCSSGIGRGEALRLGDGIASCCRGIDHRWRHTGQHT